MDPFGSVPFSQNGGALCFAEALEELSNQDRSESVAARLHLRDHRRHESDAPEPLRFGQGPQGFDHLDSKVASGASGAEFIDEQLRSRSRASTIASRSP